MACCNEIGTIFAIENSQRGKDINQDLCCKCAAREYREFLPAASAEIQALGFNPGDYI